MSYRFKQCVPSLVGTLLLTSSAAGVYAQIDTGAVSGTVRDSAGAVIPGAHLTLKNEQTGVQTETHAEPSGNYSFNGVAPARRVSTRAKITLCAPMRGTCASGWPSTTALKGLRIRFTSNRRRVVT